MIIKKALILVNIKLYCSVKLNKNIESKLGGLGCIRSCNEGRDLF